VSDSKTAKPTGVLAALRQAFGMVRRAGRGVLAAYAINLGLTLVLAGMVFDAIHGSLGSSLAGQRMREGWDARWYEGFAAQAQGIAATFRPSVSGGGGVLDALDAFSDGFATVLARGAGNGILLALGAYLFVWAFLGAAFLGTFAQAPGGAGFLQRGAHWFPRILPLTVAGLVVYAALLGPGRAWLEAATDARLRDVIDERLRFAWVLAVHVGLWGLIALVNLVFDYAKVLLVLRDEADALARPFRAVGSAAALVWRRPAATLGLYATTAALGLALLAAYVALAPRPSYGSWAGIAGALVLGQTFVLSRIAVRALFLAGEVALASPVVGVGERPGEHAAAAVVPSDLVRLAPGPVPPPPA
jgi:hypothetical protein